MLALVLAGCGGAAKSESDLSSDALNRGLKAHNAGNFEFYPITVLAILVEIDE